ncbi:Asp-tRNA(Asn)/Glu-tRNA(Gln) amidotransferase subunit GatA [soil metagenome]
MIPIKLSRRGLLAGLAAGTGSALMRIYGCSRVPPGKIRFDGDPTRLDLSEASVLIQRGELSPVDATRSCLERIERVDKRLNSFITVSAEQAMDAARQAENEIATGLWRGPMHGVPIGVKDNVDTAGILTTAASQVFANRVPLKDAEVIKTLRNAGAIILGKLNMHEFAQGTTSAISHYGAVRNPWNVDRVAGGSSGGSGAAVAAGLCFGAVGTDTGGSIRIPASCCGIVGLKPTFGVVSAKGTIPVSPSFDHVGPMCRTVKDTAFMFQAMTGNPAAFEFDTASEQAVSGLRIGLLSDSDGICDVPIVPEVRAVTDVAIDVIRSLVAGVKNAALPMPDLGEIIDYESYSYHAQFFIDKAGLYDKSTLSEIRRGRNVSKKAYNSLIERLDRHRKSIQNVFDDVDLVVVPTLPELPIAIKDATEPFSQNACTFAFSIAGLPAISVPCGFSESGLPIGLLISGPPFSEGRLLALAMAYEKAAGWDKRRPDI